MWNFLTVLGWCSLLFFSFCVSVWIFSCWSVFKFTACFLSCVESVDEPFVDGLYLFLSCFWFVAFLLDSFWWFLSLCCNPCVFCLLSSRSSMRTSGINNSYLSSLASSFSIWVSLTPVILFGFWSWQYVVSTLAFCMLHVGHLVRTVKTEINCICACTGAPLVFAGLLVGQGRAWFSLDRSWTGSGCCSPFPRGMTGFRLLQSGCLFHPQL